MQTRRRAQVEVGRELLLEPWVFKEPEPMQRQMGQPAQRL